MPKTFTSLRPSVKAAGTKLSTEQHAVLTAMRVTNSLGTPAHARLTFTVTKESPTIPVKLGNDIVIAVDGLKDEAGHDVDWTVFDGIVVSTGVELGTGTTQTLVVEAFDKLYKLGRETVAETHLQKKPADVIQQLASQAGLQADISGSLKNADPRVAAFQFGTAYSYIDRMVRDDGSEWFVTGPKLYVRPRADAADGPVTLTVGKNLLEFSARFSGVDHVDKVTVTGWDVKKKSAIVGEAASTGKMAGSNEALTSNAAKKAGIGGTKALTIPRPVADQAEAQRLATGIVRRRESDMLRARGRIIPDDGVVPGAKLAIEGMVGDWDGTYYCTEVEHVWGRSSFDTYFEVGSSEPDSLVDLLGGSAAAPLERMLSGLTIGIVTDNKDPENLNRVKLKLPYLTDTHETGWARVLQAGAGAGRGWSVLPEIDDEVLVGFEHSDLDRPYVLGGLVNGKDNPKYNTTALVKNGKVDARVFNSRLGHEIRVADGQGADEQFVSITTAGKEAKVFIGKEKIDVEATGIPIKVFNKDGTIEVAKNGAITLDSKDSITIKATQNVTIEGASVSIKATNAAKMEGNTVDVKATTQGTFDGGMNAAVKGAVMVKIN
jgi:uncharacterized protein involved in type VI secretion and phage assembly